MGIRQFKDDVFIEITPSAEGSDAGMGDNTSKVIETSKIHQ